MHFKKIIAQIVGAGALIALCTGSAYANLLTNPGFEDAPFGGAEEAGAGAGWSTFGSPFRVQQAGAGPCDPITCAGAREGTVALKVFGVAGAFQDFPAAEGETFQGDVFAVNPANADVLTGGQVGAVNIEWHNAGGFIDFTAGTTIDASTPVDEWTNLMVVGSAPAGTTFARFVVITGDFAGAGGGAPRFDAAFFEREATVIPVPAAVWLFGSGLLGLVGVARRRKAKA